MDRQIGYQLADFLDLLWVKAICGFIKDKDFRVVDQGLGQTDPLPVTLGQFSDRPADNSFQAAITHDPHDGLLHRPALDALDTGDECKVVIHDHVAVQGYVFRQIADPFADLKGILKTVITGNHGLAGCRGKITGEDAHGCRLARAVGAEKANSLAFLR